MTPQQIEAIVADRAKQFTDENINNPSPSEYLLIQNAMTIGWELGVRQSIEYMQSQGVTVKPPKVCPRCGNRGEMFTSDLDWCPTCKHQWAGS
jgi:hypothetical protein